MGALGNPVVIAIVSVTVLIVLLPAYVFYLSKFAQVGRLAGTRFFVQRCTRKGDNRGTDGSRKLPQ